MLQTRLARYDKRDDEKIEEAISILTTTDWTVMEVGRYEINDDFNAQVLEYTTQDIEQSDFEIHHHRLDIHYIVEGEEIIEVSTDKPRETQYLEERDLAWVEKPQSYSRVRMSKGDMLIIGMNEPHRTNGVVASPVPVKKIVLKMKH